MRMSEKELMEYNLRQQSYGAATCVPRRQLLTQDPIPEYGLKDGHAEKIQKPAEKKSLVIVLPFKLPTWNLLLGVNRWQRAKIRHWLHDAVSSCIPDENASAIQMVSVLRPSLTESSIAEYYRMITAKSSAKSDLPKKSRIPKKRK